MVWIQIINVYYDSITNLEIQMIQNKNHGWFHFAGSKVITLLLAHSKSKTSANAEWKILQGQFKGMAFWFWCIFFLKSSSSHNNGSEKRVPPRFVSFESVFHFHDYGRKGKGLA